MGRIGFGSLAAIAPAVACTPSRPSTPAPAEAPPVVSVAEPGTPAPPASLFLSPPPTREPERARTPRFNASRCPPLTGPGVASRGSNKYVDATTPAECKRCSGDWGPHGLVGATGCLCKTPDAGKACESPHDCTAECLVNPDNALDLSRVCPSVGARFDGYCAATYTTFGCHGFIVEKSTPAGPLRGVRYVCLD